MWMFDTAILSKSFKGCTKMLAIKAIDPQTYDKWKAAHKCGLNHKGSSSAMETVSAEKIFKQLATKHNLYYTSLYDDSDSKAFPVVENSYTPEKPVKSTNVLVTTRKGLGHVFKRKKKAQNDLLEKVL